MYGVRYLNAKGEECEKVFSSCELAYDFVKTLDGVNGYFEEFF